MKKYVIIIAILFTGTLFAQDAKDSKPVLEMFGNKMKVTYFHDNGQMQQQGYYKNGKLDGVWTSFDEEGNKTAIGEYSKGVKTGKWFFWSQGKDQNKSLCEVDFYKNQVIETKNWKQEALVNEY